MKPEAFTSIPQLRDTVVPPDQSELRVTPELIATWDARALANGLDLRWRVSDAGLEASRRAVLGDCAGGEDIWVFGYGSLMWDPGFHFEEVRLAEIEGYQRRFCIRLEFGRGSRAKPALMLGLEPGASACQGVVFRIAGACAECESAVVWRREMLQDHYRPFRTRVATPQGAVDALVFAANTAHPQYVGELPIGQTAAIIATGEGELGTNRQYLENLVAHFEAFRIEEDYLRRLLIRVQSLAPADTRLQAS
ncbi:MAG: gamma-glutamylcyclotransferase [Burkholderiaceae bacterium]|nr:MAG: gamma-glutamylcyclotransferase [Burkholderiaceae bacterium]